MTCYVAGYDTEAIYPWWEIGDRPYSASIYREMVSYETGCAMEKIGPSRRVRILTSSAPSRTPSAVSR